MKLFLDTNIVIDFLSGREPFADDAIALFQLADNHEVELVVTDLTLVNTVYVLQRLHYPIENIYEALYNIRPLINIVPIGEAVIDMCLQRKSSDFEDEVQYFAAVNAEADYIVTRNKKDFDFGDEAVVTPKELFSKLNIEFE
jgi:predicted nucleic acid-binding protein